MVGPLVGGQLIDAASWRWIFAINVPFVAARRWSLVMVAVPQRARHGRAAAGRLARRACCRSSALAGPTLALIRQPQSGWGAPDVLVPGVGGLVFFALFLVARGDHAVSDAAAGAVPAPQLHRGQHRRRSRCTPGCRSLFFYLVLFLQQVARLQRARGGAGDAAHHGGDVPALQARGRAGGPLRRALVHGRRRAAGRLRACCSCCASTPTPTTSPSCCRRCWCSRSGCRRRWRR